MAMYAEHGPDMLDRLNGIFAFAIWDSRQHALFLARDRLGVKPLYYAQHDDVLYFASEVKALLPVLPPAAPAPDRVADYLTFLWVPDPTRISTASTSSPPGHCAIFRDGRLDDPRYWDMWFDAGGARGGDWATGAHAIAEAVNRQMVSDVPLGSFLSGGHRLERDRRRDEGGDSAASPRTRSASARRTSAHEIVPDDVRYAGAWAKAFEHGLPREILEPGHRRAAAEARLAHGRASRRSGRISTYLICSAARSG